MPFKIMKLLNSYEDRDEAEAAERLISGQKRLASERDGTETVYNLFGTPSWTNFYNLNMFNLVKLKDILGKRKIGEEYDETMYREIKVTLNYVSKTFELKIPEHWF